MPRWEPDDQLIPAVLVRVRPYTMASLSPPDRCWVVAGLTLAGLTAEDIAERLSCSLRLVRTIRAEDMTAVCQAMQAESSHFADELRMVRSELAAQSRAVRDARSEVAHLRAQLVRLAGGRVCSRGHDLSSPYSVYTNPRSGRRFCRECHRSRQAHYRRQARTPTAHTEDMSEARS